LAQTRISQTLEDEIKNLKIEMEAEIKDLREEMNELKEREIALRVEVQTLMNTLALQGQQSQQKTKHKEKEWLLEYESVDPVGSHKCDDEWKVVMVDDTSE
jgi:regulator of replication initiation timing